MDNRAVTPVIEKTISIGVVLLFVAGLTTTFVGGTVPDYRTETGEEIANRVLAAAADTVTDVVPTSNGTVNVRAESELPGTIAGQDYRIRLRGNELRLQHPNPHITSSTRLAMSPGVGVQNSTWRGGQFEARLSGPPGNRSLTIGSG